MITQETISAVGAMAAWIVPLITGSISAVRAAVGLPDRYVPLISLCLGIALGLLAIEATITGGLVGAMCGLSSTGLYEFIKKPKVEATGILPVPIPPRDCVAKQTGV